ncbi:MAG TPA: hypothetical protein VFI69_03605 [Candidatus Limnocylindrales bacterium]|jgi:hypothetical protein|nr:hypothetical protein [Candidatus Limnocylindrales bacterium]
MDPSRPASIDDPAVTEILERAARLTTEQLVELARNYTSRDGATTGGIDRRRVLALARARADRPGQMRELEVAAAQALAAIGPASDRPALRRLGILEAAERAVTDALMAVALRDRLGDAAVEALTSPWASVR